MILSVGAALAQASLIPIEGQVLLGFVLGRDRSWLVAHRDDALTPAQMEAFFALAKRRRNGEPVAYLTGVREFWGLSLAVTPDVLIPRPETETLVERALACMPPAREVRVLDLGTGSGAIALALAHERPRARVVGSDVSAAALAVARANAARLDLARVTFVQADWYAGVPDGAFDVIVSNPPYVAGGDPHLTEGDLRFEPATALTPGGTGLAALATIIEGAPARLVPGGSVLVEHGYDQADAVRVMLLEAGLVDPFAARDLAGIWRAAGARRATAV
jgi:release factor glutamine methyltransferase